MTIYVIGSEGSSLVKIGYSRDPEKRLQEISRMSAHPMKILWVSTPDCGRQTETWLHRTFRQYRCHGEWFDFDTDDPIVVIESVLRDHLAASKEAEVVKLESREVGLSPSPSSRAVEQYMTTPDVINEDGVTGLIFHDMSASAVILEDGKWINRWYESDGFMNP